MKITLREAKDNLDWDTINKLTNNSDFENFLERVKNDLIISEIREEQYDKIEESDDLIRSIHK